MQGMWKLEDTTTMWVYKGFLVTRPWFKSVELYQNTEHQQPGPALTTASGIRLGWDAAPMQCWR